MADSAQKRKGQMLSGVASSSSIFSGLVSDESDTSRKGAEEINRVIKIKKSPNYLRLCIRTEDFPLSPGDRLYVNAQRKGRSTLYRSITVRGERTFVTDDAQSFDTLTKAAAHIQNWRDPHKIEMWTVVKVKTADGFITLNSLFEKNWKSLGLPLNTMEDGDRISEIVTKGDLRQR